MPLLRRVCLEQLGEPPEAATAVRLSEQMVPGTFRVVILTKGGRQWRVIYKAAAYGADHYFPSVGLRAAPGLPEYLLYTTSHDDLNPYLPSVYAAEELSRGESYRYVIEDLEDRYRPPFPTDLLTIVGQLPKMHSLLSAWVAGRQDVLPAYDRRWTGRLLHYARSSLEAYARQSGSETAAQVLRYWGAILKVRSQLPQGRQIGGVHGDLKPSNVLTHRSGDGQIKLVDWDGAGRGPAHGDLVALLAGAPPEMVDEALRLYATRDGSLSLDEHRRMYEWCSLEDILLITSRAARRSPHRVEALMWRLLFTCMKLPS